MAACTTRSNTRVVHCRTTFEAGGRFVAGFTSCGGGNMSTWFSLDVGEAAAVAGRTAGGDACVVHRRWRERCGALMAGLTSACRWEVSR